MNCKFRSGQVLVGFLLSLLSLLAAAVAARAAHMTLKLFFRSGPRRKACSWSLR